MPTERRRPHRLLQQLGLSRLLSLLVSYGGSHCALLRRGAVVARLAHALLEVLERRRQVVGLELCAARIRRHMQSLRHAPTGWISSPSKKFITVLSSVLRALNSASRRLKPVTGEHRDIDRMRLAFLCVVRPGHGGLGQVQHTLFQHVVRRVERKHKLCRAMSFGATMHARGKPGSSSGSGTSAASPFGFRNVFFACSSVFGKPSST